VTYTQAGKPGVISTAPPAGAAPNPRYLTRELWFMYDPATNVNFWRTRSIAGVGNQRFNYYIPLDVVNLVSVDIIGFPNGTIAAAVYDLNTNYAALGELENTHITNLLGNVISVTAGIIYAINLLPTIPNWSPGDFVGTQLAHAGFGTTGNYLGIRMRYQT
jgi:hypothetical protein